MTAGLFLYIEMHVLLLLSLQNVQKDDLEIVGGWRRVAKFIQGYLLLFTDLLLQSGGSIFLTNNLEFIYQIGLIVLFLSHASPSLVSAKNIEEN